MIQATIFELLEGLKIFYRYDGNPEIHSNEGLLAIKSEKFLSIKKIDEDRLNDLRWKKCKLKNNFWSIKI